MNRKVSQFVFEMNFDTFRFVEFWPPLLEQKINLVLICLLHKTRFKTTTYMKSRSVNDSQRHFGCQGYKAGQSVMVPAVNSHEIPVRTFKF